MWVLNWALNSFTACFTVLPAARPWPVWCALLWNTLRDNQWHVVKFCLFGQRRLHKTVDILAFNVLLKGLVSSFSVWLPTNSKWRKASVLRLLLLQKQHWKLYGPKHDDVPMTKAFLIQRQKMIHEKQKWAPCLEHKTVKWCCVTSLCAECMHRQLGPLGNSATCYIVPCQGCVMCQAAGWSASCLSTCCRAALWQTRHKYLHLNPVKEI